MTLLSISPSLSRGRRRRVEERWITASFNRTLIHVTDLSGRESLARITEQSAMRAAHDVSLRCKELGITAMHVKILLTDDNKIKNFGPLTRAIGRRGMKFGRIENVIPIPTGSTCRKGGLRRRRL